MRKSVSVPLIFGIAGVAVLIALGKWQVDRLAWKEGVLADIEARISAEPVALPETADPEADRYLPVAVTGQVGERALRVLVSRKQVGAGYRLISALETGGRRVLLDRGFVKVGEDSPAPPGEVMVRGNLHWPDDRLSSTPENDVAGNTWFARDIAQMAGELGTEPLLIVARAVSPPEQGVTPLPVDTKHIPNDHLSYAITWFSLAVIWAAMTGAFIWRQRRAAKGAGA
ncbi:MAG: SURF1 family protein [Roseovarius sp.]|nr:SURF1 family protein [Roseovarius sp.]